MAEAAEIVPGISHPDAGLVRQGASNVLELGTHHQTRKEALDTLLGGRRMGSTQRTIAFLEKVREMFPYKSPLERNLLWCYNDEVGDPSAIDSERAYDYWNELAFPGREGVTRGWVPLPEDVECEEGARAKALLWLQQAWRETKLQRTDGGVWAHTEGLYSPNPTQLQPSFLWLPAENILEGRALD